MQKLKFCKVSFFFPLSKRKCYKMINITVQIFKTFQYVPSAAVYSGHRVEAHAGQDCFFLTIFSIILFCNRTFRGTNVVYLYFSLPIKQYLNCCRNEIFFSVCVWAIFKPDFKLSSEESLSWTLKMDEIILLLQRNFLFIFCCYLFMFTSIWCLVSDLVPLNLICPCDAGAPWPRFDWMLFN